MRERLERRVGKESRTGERERGQMRERLEKSMNNQLGGQVEEFLVFELIS